MVGSVRRICSVICYKSSNRWATWEIVTKSKTLFFLTGGWGVVSAWNFRVSANAGSDLWQDSHMLFKWRPSSTAINILWCCCAGYHDLHWWISSALKKIPDTLAENWQVWFWNLIIVVRKERHRYVFFFTSHQSSSHDKFQSTEISKILRKHCCGIYINAI